MHWINYILIFITVIIVIYSYVLFLQNNKLVRENEHLRLNIKSIDILSNFKVYDYIHHHVHSIFEKTKADRFLILYAVNGREPFKYATAFFEVVRNLKDSGAIYKYVDVKIDESYRDLLKQAVGTDKLVILEVDSMPDSILKNIYRSPRENVNHSLIKYLHRVHINKKAGVDLLIFSSIATKNKLPFSDEEINIINTEMNLIRKIVLKMKFI